MRYSREFNASFRHLLLVSPHFQPNFHHFIVARAKTSVRSSFSVLQIKIQCFSLWLPKSLLIKSSSLSRWNECTQHGVRNECHHDIWDSWVLFNFKIILFSYLCSTYNRHDTSTRRWKNHLRVNETLCKLRILRLQYFQMERKAGSGSACSLLVNISRHD